MKELKDFYKSVEIKQNPKHLHVSTYKSAVVFTSSAEHIWMTAEEAKVLGNALIKASKIRTKLDKQKKP